MAHSTTARLRHQIFRLNQGEQADLDFGLGEILPPEDLMRGGSDRYAGRVRPSFKST